jgi:RNA polymerase sigma-70 factor (ECF subfamily)
MLKHNRQRHLRQIQETADYSEHISLPQEGDSCLSLLLTEIEQLPTRQQEVLYLKYFEGMDYEEISQIMSVNYQVVRNYAYRGLSRLRKRLQSANRLVINWLILMPLLFFG